MNGSTPDNITASALAPLALSFSLVMWVFLGIFMLIGWVIWNKRKEREYEMTAGGHTHAEADAESNGRSDAGGSTRIFGAFPQPRWLLTFEFWLHKLEDITGYETTTMPGRLLVSSLFLSLGPAVVVGLPTSMLLPQTAGLPFFGLASVGAVVGLVTAWILSQPAYSFFEAGRLDQGLSQEVNIMPDEDFISLGDEYEW